MSLNKKILLFLLFIIVLFAAVSYYKTAKTNIPDKTSPAPSPTPTSSQNEPPKIVSTTPDPLENAIIGATSAIEIVFNRSLENVGEFKIRLEPKIDMKVELSQDRKTVKIIPTKPFELGVTYTLFIGPETKFDGIGRWGEEKIFHFKTVTYKGV